MLVMPLGQHTLEFKQRAAIRATCLAQLGHWDDHSGMRVP